MQPEHMMLGGGDWSKSKSIILGCSGLSLTPDEVAFYRDECLLRLPLLCSQLLCSQLKGRRADTRSGDHDVRLRRPVRRAGDRRPGRRVCAMSTSAAGAELSIQWYAWRDLPWGASEAGLRAAWLHARLHAFDLRRYGVTAYCLPVFDVPVQGTSDVIGTRTYSHDPMTATDHDHTAAEGLLAGGVLPVMKRIPGHGSATADTHFELTTVTEDAGRVVPP